MVPSLVFEECPVGGEELFDRVFSSESPIAYSSEVEVVSTKAIPEGGGGDDVVFEKEMARAVPWAAGVLLVVSKVKATTVPVEVNKALAVVADTGASLPYLCTVPIFASIEAGAKVGMVSVGE